MIIDSHTHVQFPQFNEDRGEVVKRALDNGIWMVNAGADKKSSQAAIELAHKYTEGVYATVGQHPGENDFDYDFYKLLASDKKVVAIGEFGFEYYIRDPNLRKFGIKNEEKERQRDIFLGHLKIAKEVSKPLIVHCREAFSDLIYILKSNILNNKSPGVIHFFTGTMDDAKKLLEMGFYFTFGGLITFNRDFDEIIKFIPLENLLLETDAPYVSPEPYRGKRNEPIYIIETAEKMAEIKNISFEQVCKTTTQNAKTIFNLT